LSLLIFDKLKKHYITGVWVWHTLFF